MISTESNERPLTVSFEMPVLMEPMEWNSRKRPFRRGRDFYESIGSPKKVLAPMVNQSEFVSWSAPVSSAILSCRLM